MLNIFRKQPANLKNELLSGLTVALALVPEAVAFAFVAGVSPVIGLYSAFFLCFLCAIFGGRPGMISGATGAMAVVVVALVATHGIEYLFPTVILCGLIQLLVGIARLGVLIRMVPHSVMLGFVNGLAIVICMAQFGSFKTVTSTGAWQYIRGPALWIMAGLVALTMLIIWLLPKLTKAVPAPLVAILLVSGLGTGLNHYLPAEIAAVGQTNAVMTVGDMLASNAKFAAGGADIAEGAASLSAGLPSLFFLAYKIPPIDFSTLAIILPFALILAGVGLIESLMTLTLIDEITETQGSGNRECLGQGFANVVCGLFGGMGGCAMIGQSLINVESGGRGRTSAIFAAVCLLLFVLVLSGWIEQVPMAALVGVMFMVVIGTFEWASIRLLKRVPLSDYIVMLVVTLYTAVMHDLATAVIIGVIVSALVFTFKHAKNIAADIRTSESGEKFYQLHGPLFFASTAQFKELFDAKSDPEVVYIDFYYTRVYDNSAMEAIHTVAKKYTQVGKELHLTHLSDECRTMLERAGDVVDVSFADTKHFHVTTDRITRSTDNPVSNYPETPRGVIDRSTD